LSFEDWLYKKAEQNAHSEILSFLMMVLGMNLLIGGLIVTIIVVGQPNLFLFVIQQPLNQSAALGLILTVTGFAILSAGFMMVIYYDRQRTWHLREIEKSTKIKNRKITVKTTNEILEELTHGKKGS
jgi:hypothetical protein